MQHLVGLSAFCRKSFAGEVGVGGGAPSGVAPRPCSGLCLSARRRVSQAAVPPAASETDLPDFCP